MRSSVYVLFCLLAVGGFHASTRASTIKPLSFGERVAKADLIFRGRVVNLETVTRGARLSIEGEVPEKESVLPRSESEAEEARSSAVTHELLEAPVGLGVEGGEMLFTRVTVAVEEEIYGVAGREVVFQIAGGSNGEHTVTVEGMPEFELGRSYVLFLLPDFEVTADPVVGVNQGVFQVAVDASGEEVLLDAHGDFVIGIDNDEVVLRHSTQAATRPSPTLIAGPVPDNVPGAAAAVTSAEAARYWTSAEAAMTPGAFTEIVRQAKAEVIQ